MRIEQLPGFIQGLAGEMDAAARIAGDESLKTARAWIVTYVRHRKALILENAPIPKRINQSMKSVKPRRGTHFADMRWELRVRAIPMPMAAYPHSPVPGLGGGVRVEINKGRPKLVKHAFIATVKSGTERSRAALQAAGGVPTLHTGIFVRQPHAAHQPAQNKWGVTQLPIRELFTSTIADVISDGLVQREIQERAQEVYAETFARAMENGVAKKLAAKWAARRRR